MMKLKRNITQKKHWEVSKMVFTIPEEKRKLERIFKPYEDGCKLRDDAPEEAKKAYEEFYKWFTEKLGDNQ